MVRPTFDPLAVLRPVAAVLGLSLSLGCGGDDERAFVIGAAGAWHESNTEMTRRGIDLAIEEANAKQSKDQPKLQLLAVNDSGSGPVAARAATSLIANRQVAGVIGHLNSAPMVAAARVYDGELAAVSPSASSPDLSGISRWFFRTIPSDSAAGAALGRFASTLGRRAVVLYENDSYGRGLAQSFRQHYSGQIVSIDPIGSTSTDVATFVSYSATVAKPDLVFVAGVEQSGLALLREARRQQLAVRFLGGEGWLGVTQDTAASQGVYIGVPFDARDPRPAAQAFVGSFRQRWGVEPDAYAALAYDATTVLAQAVVAANGDREGVRAHLAGLRARGGFAGATGEVSFNAAGDPVGRDLVMARVQKGVLVVANAAP